MKDISDSKMNFAVIASAGSGKTFQLVLRVISLLLNNVNPKDILALTFTNEATNEMKNRIISLLNYLAGVESEDNGGLETAMKYLEPIFIKLAEKERCEYDRKFVNKVSSEKLESFLKEYSNLNIQTIDSYVNKIINIFPFESNITPNFTVVTDNRYNDIVDIAFGEMIDDLFRTDNRFEEIIFFKSRVYDKSKTKILEYIKEISEFVAGNYISLKKAIEDINTTPDRLYSDILNLEDIEKDIMQQVKNLQEIFSNAIVNEGFDSVKYKNKKTIISNTKTLLSLKYLQEIYAVKLLLDSKSFEKASELFNISSHAFYLRDIINSQLNGYLHKKGDIIKTTALYLGGRLYRYLLKKKRKLNILTFNDITEAAFNILVVNKIDAEYRYFRLDAKINHILIDEFQDTSLLQWSIIKPLVDEAVAGIGQYDKVGSFFFVGDDKQMLYRFRGSGSNLSKMVIEEYVGRINQITLDMNYRSDKKIVEFVNTLFQKITEHSEFNYLSNIDIYKLNQRSVSENDGFVSVNIIEKGSEEFINFTVAQIKQLIEKGFTYRNIAILLPTNEQGFTLRSELLLNDIPTQLITSFKLNNGNVYKIIRSLISYIYFENSLDLLNFLLLKPTKYNTESIDNKSVFIATGLSILSMKISNEPSIFKQLMNIFDKLNLYNRFADEPDFEVIIDFFVHNLSAEFNPILFLEAFETFALSTNSKSIQRENSVKIMTINQSKGLQFDIVILPKLDLSLSEYKADSPFLIEEGFEVGSSDIRMRFSKKVVELLPDYKDAMLIEKEKIKIDKLNLLYVALTRAKHGLIIAASEKTTDDSITSIQYLFPIFGYNNYSVGDINSLNIKQHSERSVNRNPFDSFKPVLMKKDDIVIKPDDTEDYYEAMKGTVIHNTLFMLKSLDTVSVDLAVDYAVSKSEGVLSLKDITDIRITILKLIDNEFYKKIYLGQLFKEKVFSRKGSLYKIDFFSIIDDKIVLIDYKYSKPSEENIIRYKNQLNLYSSILNENYKLEVESYLCFLRNADIFFERIS